MDCGSCCDATAARYVNELFSLRATLECQEKDNQRTVDLLKAKNARIRKQANLASEAARLNACALLNEIAELQRSNKQKNKQLANRAGTRDMANNNRIVDMIGLQTGVGFGFGVENEGVEQDIFESKTSID